MLHPYGTRKRKNRLTVEQTWQKLSAFYGGVSRFTVSDKESLEYVIQRMRTYWIILIPTLISKCSHI